MHIQLRPFPGRKLVFNQGKTVNGIALGLFSAMSCRFSNNIELIHHR